MLWPKLERISERSESMVSSPTHLIELAPPSQQFLPDIDVLVQVKVMTIRMRQNVAETCTCYAYRLGI